MEVEFVGSPLVKGFGQGEAALARWAEETFQPEDEVQREIRERSLREGLPPIQVGRMDGLHRPTTGRPPVAEPCRWSRPSRP
jgi:caffeoyl-CoA O-methyltransferase